MRVVIMGAGGLGSVVGGYLARTGVEVTLIGRPAQVAAIEADGLRIETPSGEHLVVLDNLTAVSDARDATGDFDYFVLGVKSKDTSVALADCAPLVGRIGAAISLQNSIRKDDRVAACFGPEIVLGASITDAGKIVGPGQVKHAMAAPTAAYVGEVAGATSARSDALAAALTEADLATKSVPNIMQVEWEKLAQICIVASWATSTLGVSDTYVADAWAARESVEHYVRLGKEVLGVLQGMGHEVIGFYAPVSHVRQLAELSFDDAVAMIDKLGGAMRKRGMQLRPSMHEDMLRGRITEADDIIEPFLAAAAAQGTEVPTLLGAYRAIKGLEAAIGAT